MWFFLNSSVSRKLFIGFTSVKYQIKGFLTEIQIKMRHTPASLLLFFVVVKVLTHHFRLEILIPLLPISFFSDSL